MEEAETDILPGETNVDIDTAAYEGATDDVSGDAYVKEAFLGLDGTAWVSLGMILLIGIFIWKRVPAMIAKALDDRAAKIRQQLEEAAALRAEAEALRDELEGKRAAAEGEAKAILDRAATEAEALKKETAAQIEALIARREKSVNDRIAAAERAAEQRLRAEVAERARAIAAEVIAKRPPSETSDLVDGAISRLDQRLKSSRVP